MNEFQIALAIGAVIAVAVAWRVPRAAMWILAGAMSFIASTAWARYGMPYPPVFTGLCDAAICLGIYFFGKSAWEMRLWRLFQASVLVSLLYFVGVIGPHWAYIVALEAINWLALLLIIGFGVVERYGNAARWRSDSRVRWAFHTLRAERPERPFSEVE